MRTYLLREEFLSAARAAVAIREEYRETGVVIEAENLASKETGFLLMTPELSDPGKSLVTLSFAQLEELDSLSDQAFGDALWNWTESEVRQKCDCAGCRELRGEKPARIGHRVQSSNFDLSRLLNDRGYDL